MDRRRNHDRRLLPLPAPRRVRPRDRGRPSDDRLRHARAASSPSLDALARRHSSTPDHLDDTVRRARRGRRSPTPSTSRDVEAATPSARRCDRELAAIPARARVGRRPADRRPVDHGGPGRRRRARARSLASAARDATRASTTSRHCVAALGAIVAGARPAQAGQEGRASTRASASQLPTTRTDLGPLECRTDPCAHKCVSEGGLEPPRPCGH